MPGRTAGKTPPEADLPEWQLARRGLIVTAAIDLLVERSYDQIQIRDVSQRAGVALGTLYRYFESKEHLYAVALIEWVRPMREPSPHPGKDAATRLRSKLHLLVAANKKYPNFLAMQHSLHASTNPLIHQLLAEYQQAGFDWLVSELDVLEEERARDLGLMLWGINNAVFTRIRLSFGSYDDAKRVGDKFIDLIAPELHEAEKSTAPADSAAAGD
ncbi:TetR/AcrR family transcriptional regulator [Nocardia bovistercoris]|uniref:TetR/AcrR family transcriptional regulator n=1 Tax=Nocardia bovistercoris TaxID=2785916 RepID=A0A931IEL3_9NOCA|nr:TetR/AcrR family transcriptional regulator [Nocardia bovistercoris]MBH0779801.1 TetR/AcrR family transcriptional regulator [Nocardia bovistercoris]